MLWIGLLVLTTYSLFGVPAEALRRRGLSGPADAFEAIAGMLSLGVLYYVLRLAHGVANTDIEHITHLHVRQPSPTGR